MSAPQSVPVSGDPHQLHQVLANLMRNALMHTPPGTPIEVSVATETGTATVIVRDHGPGLPAAPGAAVRALLAVEGGRERGRAGAGLGLSIVQEIVTAHGGHVTAENPPGGGASFLVSLPVSEPGHDSAAAGPAGR